ncbi:hypothetical protein ILFOPFJJ_06706 [Ensifer psoraleae]|nr:hypothetical protein [Sinorhizobium psoraleae]
MKEIGEVVTAWLLYGPRARYSGTIMASPYPELHYVLPLNFPREPERAL